MSRSLSSSTAVFFLNRNVQKTNYDKIILRKHRSEDETQFNVQYMCNVTNDTLAATKSTNLTLNDSHEVLDYMEDILDLLIQDKDSEPFMGIDVMIPGYPIVGLKAGVDDKVLIRVLRNWCKRI